MKYLFVIFISMMLIGCYEVESYNTPFVNDNIEKIAFKGQIEMCKEKPNSIFCENTPTIGDIKPTQRYSILLANELDTNTYYKVSDSWHYNETIYNYLIGDCEDVAMTLINHMVEDGIDKKYLYLVYRLVGDHEAHMFVAVDTEVGLIHLDYKNSGKPIEEQINHYMPMSNAGVNNWIKGNIR